MSTTSGFLRRTRCYLSGSMEFVKDGTTWRNKVKRELKDSGIIFFDPYEKPFITSLPEDDSIRKELIRERSLGQLESVGVYFKQVRSDDLRLCDISDFAIIHVDPTIPSWGTAEELFTLNRMKKPIFIAIEGGRNNCPLWLLGTIPSKYIYNSIDEVIDIIKQIDTQEIKIDSTRWRLIQPELR